MSCPLLATSLELCPVPALVACLQESVASLKAQLRVPGGARASHLGSQHTQAAHAGEGAAVEHRSEVSDARLAALLEKVEAAHSLQCAVERMPLEFRAAFKACVNRGGLSLVVAELVDAALASGSELPDAVALVRGTYSAGGFRLYEEPPDALRSDIFQPTFPEERLRRAVMDLQYLPATVQLRGLSWPVLKALLLRFRAHQLRPTVGLLLEMSKVAFGLRADQWDVVAAASLAPEGACQIEHAPWPIPYFGVAEAEDGDLGLAIVVLGDKAHGADGANTFVFPPYSDCLEQAVETQFVAARGSELLEDVEELATRGLTIQRILALVASSSVGEEGYGGAMLWCREKLLSSLGAGPPTRDKLSSAMESQLYSVDTSDNFGRDSPTMRTPYTQTDTTLPHLSPGVTRESLPPFPGIIHSSLQVLPPTWTDTDSTLPRMSRAGSKESVPPYQGKLSIHSSPGVTRESLPPYQGGVARSPLGVARESSTPYQDKFGERRLLGASHERELPPWPQRFAGRPPPGVVPKPSHEGLPANAPGHSRVASEQRDGPTHQDGAAAAADTGARGSGEGPAAQTAASFSAEGEASQHQESTSSKGERRVVAEGEEDRLTPEEAFVSCFAQDLLQGRQVCLSQANNLYKMRSGGHEIGYRSHGFVRISDFVAEVPGLELVGTGTNMGAQVSDYDVFETLHKRVKARVASRALKVKLQGKDASELEVNFQQPRPVPAKTLSRIWGIFKRTPGREMTVTAFAALHTKQLRPQSLGFQDVRGLMAYVPFIEKVGNRRHAKYVVKEDAVPPPEEWNSAARDRRQQNWW